MEGSPSFTVGFSRRIGPFITTSLSVWVRLCTLFPGVDDGDVVYQGRPTIVADDNPNSLYEKVVRLGVEMMVQAVSDLEQRRCHSVSLTTKGRLYLNDSFTTRVKRNTWRRIQAGVLSDYLANKSERDQRVETALINDFSKVSKVRKAATVSTS